MQAAALAERILWELDPSDGGLAPGVETMDELLRTSGIEIEFVTRSLNHWVKTLSQSKVEEIALLRSSTKIRGQ